MVKRYLLLSGLRGWAACACSPPAVPWHAPSIPRCHRQPVQAVTLLLLCRAATTQHIPPLLKGRMEEFWPLPAHPLQLTDVSLVAFFLLKQPLQGPPGSGPACETPLRLCWGAQPPPWPAAASGAWDRVASWVPVLTASWDGDAVMPGLSPSPGDLDMPHAPGGSESPCGQPSPSDTCTLRSEQG